TRGDHASFVEALGLVGLKLQDGTPAEDRQAGEDTIERRRARAHVLASRPGRALRGRAVQMLEELDAQEGLFPGDRSLLAPLYEATGAWPKAGEHLRRLCEAYNREPAYLSGLVGNLLHRQKPGEAGQVLERLEALEKERALPPGDLGTVELRARLL